MRLVEATFDWHFNPVDAESMKTTSEIPTISNFKYLRWKTFSDPDVDIDVDEDEGELSFYDPNTNNLKEITIAPNTMFYSASNGYLLAVYKGTSSVILDNHLHANWDGNDWNLYTETYINSRAYSIEQDTYVTAGPVVYHQYPGIMPFNLNTDTGNGIDTLDTNDIKMTNVYMAVAEIDKDYLGFANLSENSTSFSPHNIWIPLISGVNSNKDSTQREFYAISAFHDVAQWSYGATLWPGGPSSPVVPSYHHSSRVINALALETFDTSSGVAKANEFLMGTGHLYDNCTAIFKNIKNSFEAMTYSLQDTSAPLGLDSQTNYNAFDDGESGKDQHSPNLMIKRRGKHCAILGTRTKEKILSNEEVLRTVFPETDHAGSDTHDGELFNAQMFIKPQFNLTDITTGTLTSHGYAVNGTSKILSFWMNNASTHNWMSFMPDLTGHYIVSNQTQNGVLPADISTLLNDGSLAFTDTTITVDSNAGFPSSGTIKIFGSYTYELGGTQTVADVWETITYTGKNSTTQLTGCTRNSTGKTHNAGGISYPLTYIHPDNSEIINITFNKSGVPDYIAKITNHTITATGGYSKHNLTLDTALNVSSNGNTYRLMRISDTTFNETPNSFEVNNMFDTGLQYNKETDNLLTGKEGGSDSYQESIYAMYMLLDIDTQNTFIERRDIDNAISLFSNGQGIDCFVTDGLNEERKSLSISLEDSGVKYLKFNYNGELTGNGLVSFGETFTIETPTKITVTPKRAFIGATVSVGSDAITAAEEILEEIDIDIDTTERNITYTGNIVSGVNGTTITLTANANTNIAIGDDIYNQDGKLIGKIGSINGINIELAEVDSGGADIFHTPIAQDEITLYEKAPFILNTNFTESDVFNTINFLSAKRGFEFQFANDKLKIQDTNNYDTKRKYSLQYKDGNNLISVDSNQSLFDKKNKVVVIGDNVKATVQLLSASGGDLKHIDANIKHAKEAKIKAEQLLTLHNTPAKKITLSMQKKGFELMKPGDLITLNFPNHNIPADDYIVFEIENAMSSIAKITVGTYNKTIAERLSEMNLSQDKGFTNVFTKDIATEVTAQFLFEQGVLKEQSASYTLTTPTGTTIGYFSTLGYSNVLSSGSDIVETREIPV